MEEAPHRLEVEGPDERVEGVPEHGKSRVRHRPGLGRYTCKPSGLERVEGLGPRRRVLSAAVISLSSSRVQSPK